MARNGKKRSDRLAKDAFEASVSAHPRLTERNSEESVVTAVNLSRMSHNESSSSSVGVPLKEARSEDVDAETATWWSTPATTERTYTTTRMMTADDPTLDQRADQASPSTAKRQVLVSQATSKSETAVPLAEKKFIDDDFPADLPDDFVPPPHYRDWTRNCWGKLLAEKPPQNWTKEEVKEYVAGLRRRKHTGNAAQSFRALQEEQEWSTWGDDWCRDHNIWMNRVGRVPPGRRPLSTEDDIYSDNE